MEFLEYTKELNELAISLQDNEEVISLEDVIKAVFYINNMYIEDTGDCLIFLAALNLCNAYVKYDRKNIGYSFKKGIEYLIDVLNNRCIKDIYVNNVNNGGKLYLFQIGEIQFSFHDEKNVIVEERYLKDLVWDGVRKQKCAKAIFDSVVKNKLRVTNKTYRGKDLSEKLDKVLDNYKTKKIDSDDLLVFKI